MGRKKTPGLFKRNGVWHIDKRIKGYGRVCESTGASTLGEAENFLTKRLGEIRYQTVHGVRPKRTFRQAATKYLTETTKRSLARDAECLKNVDCYIGDLPIEKVHMGTLEPFISKRREEGVKSATVSRELAVIRHILHLAARMWRDHDDRPWLDTAPLLVFPNWEDAAEPYPLNWDEQGRLFKLLPDHLHRMALFKVNTGLREQGICWLRWDWEVQLPELETSIFISPGKKTVYCDDVWPGEKNKENQIVVLNRIARSIINEQRGKHDTYVFPYKGRRLGRLHNSAWKRAWKNAGLPMDGTFSKGPHNLKHTFGRRLRAVGVPLETRRALLHHTNGDITTHYSSVELTELIEAVERIAADKSRKTPAIILLRKNAS